MFWLFVASVVPVIVVLYYIRRVDRFHAEPMKLLRRLFIMGMIIVIPIVIVEFIFAYLNPFEGTLDALYNAFVVAGITEETFKWLVVMIFAFRSLEYDEPLDGIVYAVFVSMGFAIVENVMYVYNYGIGNAVMRAFTAVPAHMLFGVMSGYYLSLYKFVGRRKYIILSLVMPILLHGTYNFLLLGHSYLLILFIPYIIFMWVISTRRIKKYQMISKVRDI